MTIGANRTAAIQYVHTPFGGAHYRQAYDLRERVLRKPLGIPLRDEDTADDAGEELFYALQDEHVIASLQLKPIDATTMKLRQMAVEPNSRNPASVRRWCALPKTGRARTVSARLFFMRGSR